MSPQCVTNQRKSRMVVSERACLRVVIVCKCQDNQTECVHSVCVCAAITCQTGHAMNQWGEAWVALPLITQSLPSSLHLFSPLSTSSFFISVIIPHSIFCPLRFLVSPLFYSFYFFYLIFIPQLSLQGLKRCERCGNVYVLCLCTHADSLSPLFCVFLISALLFFKCHLVLFLMSNSLIFPILPLFLSCFVPWEEF